VNGDQPSPRGVQLRLLAAVIALAVGMAAVVIAVLLVRSVLG
jgi:hypothetical protein